jgi:hypothetical protein
MWSLIALKQKNKIIYKAQCPSVVFVFFNTKEFEEREEISWFAIFIATMEISWPPD